ncbi:MAG: FAD-dependent oxidoreductase [Candidatus Omnitrophica bacterium]|nr:FAD-dependent oxidoreductase [Candidatus Omnitrophota bacterium]
MTKKKKIIILGAGLAGLSAAWHLSKKGGEYQIFEKEPEIGGLCRSKKTSGFTFDCDGHLLHFRYPYTFNLVRQLLEDNLVEHQRSSWIYAYSQYIRYPFQANLYGLPPKIIEECLLGFIEASRNGLHVKKGPDTFLDWIYRTFGKGIAKHFMLPYNAKFWTVSPKKMTCEWLDGFIPVPCMDHVVEGAIEESLRQFGYNSRFWYPKNGGINALPLAFAKRIKNIHTNCGVERIDIQKKEITLSSGLKEKFDYLISTLPLPELPQIIRGMPRETAKLFNKLKWNSIFNLNLGIEKTDRTKRHWVYFPDEDFCFFRAGFYHNFSSSLVPQDKSSLYIEVSYSREKPVDKNNLIPAIKKDLKRVGLMGEGDTVCAEDVNDIKYGYPIYDEHYAAVRSAIIKYLAKNAILPCGRYGSWRYFSMEDTILDARHVANTL